MKYLLFASLLFLSCGGEQQNKVQQNDPLLGVMWQRAQKDANCTWLQIFDGIERVNLSFLWNSYGQDNTCLAHLFDSGREIHLRTYLSNGVCLRKDNCSDREISIPSEVAEAAIAAIDLVSTCETCSLELVPQLEDNWTHAESCIFAELLKGITEHEIIRNPVKQATVDYDNPCFDGIELHNELPEGRSVFSGSNDGAALMLSEYDFSGVHINVAEASRRRDQLGRDSAYFLWHPLGNCLHGDTALAPFPYERTCEDDLYIYEGLNNLLMEGL